MTIERTDLANIEYRAKTGEILKESHDFASLGEAMAEAAFRGDTEAIERIKAIMRSKQAWRNQS